MAEGWAVKEVTEAQYDEISMILWPQDEGVDEMRFLWFEQEVRFCGDRDQGWGLGIYQPRNGPCGLLAAMESMLVASALALPEAGGGKEIS
eukprot:CAMPEP_0119145958 /NCGR_PEP_ID=MMETSP1310-20130426/38228_1 /TAXON_ID=464262 /ORGANISM="Genus nov. species nov., Strain RCC2339" /LENGTH=90 /DNA_ID=CAMNT_0007137813 /DNA_START=20 /DNA_END=288 /DNA_ORIENTATION=-